MKKLWLPLAVVIGMMLPALTSFAGDKNEDPLKRSEFAEPNPFVYNTSFPRPFSELNNPITSPAISTGYYFVDSDDEAPDYWRPNPEIIDTTIEADDWRRVISGPRVVTQAELDNPFEGLRFFRNPGVPENPNEDRNFFTHATDSTDDAFAGPIQIGFEFYFNGIRYDSFYVSTNGVIALTNRRYFYDRDGARYIPPGAETCYDPMSMDWFTRGRNGNGLNDPTEDDYGYRYAVCGGNELSKQGGIRARGGTINSISGGYRGAYIAPFYGDMHLSQFDPKLNVKQDHGKVMYKRSTAADKLIIYYMNIAPVRTKYNNQGQSYNAPFDLRLGDQNYIACNAQVTLNRLDSSVTIVFENFVGVAQVGRGAPATEIFRVNSTVGVCGWARHVNYGQKPQPDYPWGGEYQQYTHYYSNYPANVPFPHNFLAIKFKQWKNTLRVVDIQYRVRKTDANAPLDFTEKVQSSEVNDYELLAGEERIGAIQPVAILQNLTNEIQGPQGVNFTPQELEFRARFRILNEATERIVYNRLVPIDSTCLALPVEDAVLCNDNPDVLVRYSNVTKSGANYTAEHQSFPGSQNLNGIPPYGFVQVFFPPFEPNEFVDNHIGRLRCFIIADPTDPSNAEALGDEWPFDDTASVRIFVMRRLESFNDDVSEFHLVNRVPMPSVLKWVNIDAEVSSGDDVSHHPLPPRGEFAAANNENFPMQSPVIRMDRLTLNRQNHPGATSNDGDGDELRSFPIDMRDKYGAALSVSVQRTQARDDWERGYSDQSLIGPEPRTIVNGNPFDIWDEYRYGCSRWPDHIDVELAQPSPDRLNHICNIDNKRWRNHPRRDGAKPVTDMAAYSLYGGGGGMAGFLETDKDSSLSKPGGGRLNGLRPNVYDDGIDYEFKKIYVAIPDTFINAENEGAKNFRFRIKVRATDFKAKTGCMTCIPDDDDPFFVDNIKILVPDEITDIEVSAVRIIWPYTIAPASQAVSVPIKARVSNNTAITAPTFNVKCAIFRKSDFDSYYFRTDPPLPPDVWSYRQELFYRAIYCKKFTMPFLPGGETNEVPLPRWNARDAGPGRYVLVSIIQMEGGDYDATNDTTYKEIEINFGDVYAYDPAQAPRNDVPDGNFTGQNGRGLTLYGFNQGGTASISRFQSWSKIEFAAGYEGGNGSGQIAVKFQVFRKDSVKGFQVYFGKKSYAFDDIQLALYTDQNGTPGSRIANSRMFRQRGVADLNADGEELDEPTFGEYVTYLLPTPIELDAGIYWVSIAQLGETGIELGASKSRMGMRITSIYQPPPTGAYSSQIGTSGYHLLIEKNFRKAIRGDNLINENYFAYENTMNSGTWVQFMPTIGNPAYGHLPHYGYTEADGYQTATLTRGTWIPMLRPYLGDKAYGSEEVLHDPCPEDVPVNLTTFDGDVRNNAVELVWETSYERDNYGFYVEKRNISRDEEEWGTIGFVKGVGHSNNIERYNFVDREVSLNNVYQYRLRQVDAEGYQSCESFSDVVTITFDHTGVLTLEQNVPNPFVQSTTLAFALPTEADVTFEILDVYGNVVKTLVNAELPAQRHTFLWDGTNDNGEQVPSGAYIYRLVADDEVKVGKMNFVK